MELINLKSLSLTMEELRDIIKFIAQKRGISTKQLLSTIKPNPKRKNNEILTTKTQQKVAKTQQKAAKTQEKIKKTHEKIEKHTKKQKKTYEKKKNTTKCGKTQNNKTFYTSKIT